MLRTSVEERVGRNADRPLSSLQISYWLHYNRDRRTAKFFASWMNPALVSRLFSPFLPMVVVLSTTITTFEDILCLSATLLLPYFVVHFRCCFILFIKI
ncbi:unnamed protein product [Musa banksii]